MKTDSMPYPRYTKEDLKQIVASQLKNLTTIHDLLCIVKVQNEILENANKKLCDEIAGHKQKRYSNKRK